MNLRSSALSLLLLQSAWTAANSQQSDGIALDEVELVTLEGNREVTRRPMRERDANELGRELRKRGLPANQRIMAERLEKPRLRFIDGAGKTKKEILLGVEAAISTVAVPGSKEPQKVKYFTSRSAFVSYDNSHAAVWESHGEPAETGDGRESGSWSMLDKDGNPLWERRLPRFKAPRNCKISADGSMIVVLEAWTKFHQLNPDEPFEQTSIHDKTGREVFRFPKSRASNYRLYTGTDDVAISPNGRYVALRASKGKAQVVVFIDVQRGATWDFEKDSYPVDIDDSGKARVGLMAGRRIESIDLAKQFASPK